MPDFLYFALAAGCGVALCAGPLGCFAVWRRMAYFGDTLAHSALTGVAFGLILSVNINVAVTLLCLLLALLLVVLQNNRNIATDTLLGILSHSMLALGLVVVSVFGDGRVDLYAYLFGDLLAATSADLLAIYLTAAIILPILLWLWRPLLAITVDEDLARVEGVPVTLVRTSLMLLMALVIAVAMKVVGVLLITALLILPAATSRRLVTTPEQMAICASGLGMLAIVGGLAASWWLDTPAGPSAVLSASTFFALSLARRPAI
ncbi:MAG: zinc ABC transporter permease subunit ZnuB [Gammaproteobacteria bacterium]|uniref:zinc ABC transporter permease subunit ZnuB n=1 Tax=Pseudomaricurvus alcaniphilus TaxID=1166482 RepID=UPI00140D0849|nr:zinc ABC transporter permease subunit ZnuB [Pseudomaricurvus alcaniphilus]MBR9912611.1 zinc ABC transporter permease subunit ZnuB [Gammaproteobacteria bacterium]NHN38794.1 zinc ABC transporter permease subunit ZnuB [Pseudomaricurvus alcaniphilus]